MRASRNHPFSGDDRVDVLAVGHAPSLRINRRIYTALAERGWRVELLIPEQLPKSWRTVEREPHVPPEPPIHVLPIRRVNTRTWTYIGLTDLLQRRMPRIVYLENEPDSFVAFEIGLWCARHDSKLVVNTNENDIPPIFRSLFQRRIKPALRSLRTKVITQLTKRYIAHVVAISEGSRVAMCNIGFSSRVSIVPLGFDQTIFTPDIELGNFVRKRLGLQGPVIGYFGRLTALKGVHLLIAALGRLKHLQWQALIDGLGHGPTGYEQELIGTIDRLNLADRITSIKATHEEVADYMRAADIVVMPSVWREQYGRVAPEAMACGCCVVVSDAGALPELVGTTGVIVPAGDTVALAGALAKLINDPARCSSLGRLAAERAKTLFSIERQATLLDALFLRLVGTTHAHVDTVG